MIGQQQLTLPTAAQVRYQQWEIGALYSFELTTFRSDGSDHSVNRPPMEAALYRPEQLDTDQWLAAAKAMGARFAVFTATHETGFLQWPSDLYPYGVKQIPWGNGRADVVGRFIASCRQAGIIPGLFIGLRFNVHWGVSQYRCQDASRQAAYNQMCCRQVEELLSRYGELGKIWIEGGLLEPEQGGPDIHPIVAKHQPHAVFYHSPSRSDHRWVGNEKGLAGEPCWSTTNLPGGPHRQLGPEQYRELREGHPEGKLWSAAMCDVPLRNHAWFWHAGQDHLVRPPETLVDLYHQSVGRNGVMEIGLAPDSRGLIPDADLAACTELGQRIAALYEVAPLATTAGSGATLELALPAPTRIDRVAFGEDIRHGHRIRAWELQGRTGSDGWTTMAQGQSVGHKRICRLAPVEVAALRVSCGQIAGGQPPVFRELAAWSA